MRPSLDYLAGLFDGEGTVRVVRSSGHFSRSRMPLRFQCNVALTIRERSALVELRRRFGGTIHKVRRRSQRHADYFIWQASGLGALAFAVAMRSRVRLKRKQLQALRIFQMEKLRNGNQPLPKSRYQAYVRLFARMRALNKKGPR